MPLNLATAAFDTFTAEQFPDTNHGDWNKLHVSGGTGTRRYGYTWFNAKPPVPSIVSQATLRVWLRGSWSGGPHTITARRIDATWKESLLTWDRSGPGQMGSTLNPASAAVTNGVDGDLVELDVTAMMADVAAGSYWGGIRLEIDTPDGVVRRFYSSEASDPSVRPQLEVVWNRAPLEPQDLSPSGGRSVSLSHPTLTWVFRDREGDEQSQLNVQISTTSTVDGTGAFPSPEFDSGWVASGDTQLDLSTTAYAGLADGDSRFWIVRVRDTVGLESPWSAVEEFRRDTKGTLAISSPLNGGTVDETTPTITTTLTGRAQEAIRYRLGVAHAFPGFFSQLLWDSGWFTAEAADGVPFSFAVPAGFITSTTTTYRIEVHSRDTIDREATPGDRVDVVDVADFTFVRSATPSPVTSLTVVEDEPGLRITWNRAAGVALPDFWCLVVDGVRVADRIDPVDVSQGGDPIVSELIYYGARPAFQHTIEVEAVVNDAGVLKHSEGNATQTLTVPLMTGIWLVDDSEFPHATEPRMVLLIGDDPPDLSIGESAETFYPIARRDPVRIVDAIRGREGPIEGRAHPGYIENFAWMKQPENVGRTFRLVFGDLNLPVQLGEAGDTHTDRDEREHAVSAEVYQVGEFG